MLLYLFLLFTMVPLVELALLVWIAEHTSLAFTVALVLATGVVGASLARWQGFRTLVRIQDELAAGRMPGDAMIDGVLILAAGLLLVTPGVLTDVVGFALLTPPLRALLKRGLAAWIRRRFRVETIVVGVPPTGDGRATNGATGGDQIIDAKVIQSHVEDA